MRYFYIGLLLFICCGAESQNGKFKRSAPQKKWDAFTESLFSQNSFELLNGSRPENMSSVVTAKTDNVDTNQDKINNNDFDLSDMMSKLESAESNLGESFQNEKTFLASLGQIKGYTDTIIMMGRTLNNSDPTHYEDPDSFLRLSERMTDNAKSIQIFTQQKKFDEANKAFLKLRQNCNDCHSQFRL